MAGRLQLAGVRPINSIVDITNYVMLEMGQPQHAFDLQRIKDGCIIVRRAREGESLVTLDDQRRALDPEMLLITDVDGAIAVAGLMGGADSEISESTTDILLESAYFDPVRVAIAGVRLGLLSESRRRFERGVDPTLAARAADRASALMTEMAGGTVAPGIVEVIAPGLGEPRTLVVKREMVDRLLGTAVPEEEVRDLVAPTGFEVKADVDEGTWEVTVPSWRPDVIGWAHVAEEIGRLYGYDDLGSDTRLTGQAPAGPTPRQVLRERIRDALTYLGLTEIITSTLVEKDAPHFLPEPVAGMDLANPISKELAQLRTDLLPGVLRVVQHNLNRQVADVRIFELGAVHWVEGGKAEQEEWVVGALTGGPAMERWSEPRDVMDWHDLSGLMEGLARALNLDTPETLAYDGPALDPAISATLAVRGTYPLGFAGLLSREVASGFDLDPDVWVFGLRLEALESAIEPVGRFAGLPRYPASERDVSVILAEEVQIGPLLKAISGLKRVERVRLVDEYQGEQIPAGTRGITLSVRYRHSDKTFSEEEIEALHKEVGELLEREYAARLRR
jgi:phenylalanyl-tRNA synthetase beta chain